MTKRKILLFSAFLLASGALRADETALYYLSNLAVEYEGTGFRRFDEGWELKVKPQAGGWGARWRRPFTEKLALQAQAWRNNPYYEREDGNTKSLFQRQTGQTRLAVQNLMLDLRRPLEGSRVEAVFGLEGVHAAFQRKDIIFNGAAEPGRSREALSAAGAYFGFHAGSPAGRRFYWDGEAVFGHLFWTRNAQRTEGGSIHRDGYTYHVRLEAGVRLGRWTAGLGYVRQLFQVTVPGGKAFPSGAAASLPINKIDFSSPAAVIGYAF